MKIQDKVYSLNTEVSGIIDQISMNINITNVELIDGKSSDMLIQK